MNRELRDLYNRIKGYDVESLRQTLELQLEQKRRPSIKRNIVYNHKIKECSQGMRSRIRFIQRELKSKRVTLEIAMEKIPDKTEKLLKGISISVIYYGCKL